MMMRMKMLNSCRLVVVLLALLLRASSSSSAFQEDSADGIPSTHRSLTQSNNSTSPSSNATAVTCPQDSIYHCNDPSAISGNDDTVQCDPTTCQWILGALQQQHKPKLCAGINIQVDQVKTLSGKSNYINMIQKATVCSRCEKPDSLLPMDTES
jgi:hypothetical protein